MLSLRLAYIMSAVWATPIRFQRVRLSGSVKAMATCPFLSVRSWGMKKAVSWKFSRIGTLMVSAVSASAPSSASDATTTSRNMGRFTGAASSKALSSVMAAMGAAEATIMVLAAALYMMGPRPIARV